MKNHDLEEIYHLIDIEIMIIAVSLDRFGIPESTQSYKIDTVGAEHACPPQKAEEVPNLWNLCDLA